MRHILIRVQGEKRHYTNLVGEVVSYSEFSVELINK